MKKRILSIALCAVIALGLAATGLAAGDSGIMPISLTPTVGYVPYGRPDAESEDAALTRVTLAVKGTLGIEDEYTEFSGYSNSTGPLTYWQLNWSGDDCSLSVRADSDGKILTYSYYDNNNESYSDWSSFNPRIPANKREDAAKAADEFVAPLLEEDESILWNEQDGVRELGRTTYYLYGTLLINGLKTPITVSVNVRTSDLTVTRFTRSDGSALLLPSIPSPEAEADKDEAAELLKGAYTLELQYVLDDESRQPVLRYVLSGQKQLLVDAETGELIDVQELYNKIMDRGIYNTAGSAYDDVEESVSDKLLATNAPAAAPTLSPVEQQAVDKLIGVKSMDELEKDARAIDGVGLTDKFLLASSSYSAVRYAEPKDGEDPDEEDLDVNATLRFVRERRDEEGKLIRTSKTVTLNAKTGEFVSIGGYSNEPVTLDEKAITASAEKFAKAHAEHFGEYKLYEDGTVVSAKNTANTYFCYYRTVNGVPFKNDAVTVSVDGSDGSILSFGYGYTEDLTFPDTDGIIDNDAALDAYFGAYTVELQYSQLPTLVTPEDPRPLCAGFAEAGYNYVYELCLTYGAVQKDGWLRGVDAKSGEAVITKSEPRTGIVYTDEELKMSYAADIAKELGEYGVGYIGGKLEPTTSLTQKEMLALLLSANGHEIPDEPTQDDLDYLYQAAKWMGITFDEQSPEAAVTRVEFVRTLVGVTSYGSAAKLEGIWAPGFADDAAIDAADLGSVAIARALGLVNGDTDGCFHPADGISRQDAMIVLYNFMTR